MALRYLLEAQFEDGFEYKGTQEDVSTVNPLRNVFFDIREGLHDLHGRLTRYSMQGQVPQDDGMCRRYDIDFSVLPESAKPIWYINREVDRYSDGSMSEVRDMAYGFGYEFTDSEGENQKEVIEVF